MNIKLYLIFAVIGITSLSVSAQKLKLERFKDNPIITADKIPGPEGDNINGPSLIRVPDWLPNKLGKYYLYFAHHKGKYIRLAYADDLKGPWKIYKPGTLKLTDCETCKNGLKNTGTSITHKGAESEGDEVTHIASPDVLIDNEHKQLIMYFHCPIENEKYHGQYSFMATSSNGIDFKAENEVLGYSYFRVFKWKDYWYSISRSGQLARSKDGAHNFEAGPNPFSKIQTKTNYLRHAAVKLVGDTLYVFYSKIGDTPERIVFSKINLTSNWNNWTPTAPETVAEPEKVYEGADLPLTASQGGLYYGKVRQLRDPYVFEDNNKWYLLYTTAGENAIAIGELKKSK